MSRIVIGYDQGRPLYRDEGPASPAPIRDWFRATGALDTGPTEASVDRRKAKRQNAKRKLEAA